jgi:hypothetical protein
MLVFKQLFTFLKVCSSIDISPINAFLCSFSLFNELSKVDRKILVSLELIRKFKISDLAMAKVKKSISLLPTLQCLHQVCLDKSAGLFSE